MIHPLSDVRSRTIGKDTLVWQYVVILEGARIGSNCNICSHVFIENQCIIGDHVTIKNNVMIYDGVTIGDDAFIGPSVTFINDILPRSQRRAKRTHEVVPTDIGTGTSIGANTAILCGVKIGDYAMIGAGSVVTKDIPDHALAFGNPARIMGTIDDQGAIIRRRP